MADIELTTQCASSDGAFLLPQGTAVPASLVVVRAEGGRDRLMRCGSRNEAGGDAACVSGTNYVELGSGTKKVSYRAAKTWDVVKLKDGVVQKLLLTGITAAGTIISAYLAYEQAQSDKTGGAVVLTLAALVFFLSAAGAVLTVCNDVRDALG